MKVSDKKGHHCCVEYGRSVFAFPSRATQERYLTNFLRAVFKPQYLRGAEEHGDGHHYTILLL
jgi:hypothetical protein